jgi:hypothetical protein
VRKGLVKDDSGPQRYACPGTLSPQQRSGFSIREPERTGSIEAALQAGHRPAEEGGGRRYAAGDREESSSFLQRSVFSNQR